MTRKIIYCGQFRDITGYGIAARSYLSAIDEFLSDNKDEILFKIYPIDILTNENLDNKTNNLIDKYSFNNQNELFDFLNDGEYECIWHCTSISPMFIDDRYKRKDNLKPCLKDIILGSANNYHLVVWETTKISKEWEEAIKYFGPKKIFTACEFNRKTFEYLADEVVIIPHPIDNNFLHQKQAPINMGFELDNKFKILSMSQWDQRKGFSELIFSYLSEFEKSDNTVLILKAYPSSDFRTKNEMIAEINRIKNMMDKHRSLPDIILISDFVNEKTIKWLYNTADVYASATKGEGFGLTFLEAAASGLPIIATKWSAYDEYLEYYLEVDYTLEKIPISLSNVNNEFQIYSHIWVENSKWAEFDSSSMEKNIKKVINKDYSMSRILKQQKSILNKYSKNSIMSIYNKQFGR